MKTVHAMVASLAFMLLLLPALAAAHTPYLVPADFAARAGETVTLDAAFAERFFVAETAFDNSQFSVIGPDGQRLPLQNVQRLRKRTVAEHQLAGQGTYRFSTGTRHGAVFRSWEHNGKRSNSRDPYVPIPAGAKLIADFQSLTLAETYVTVAAPDNAALKPYGHGLELLPVTHPNDLYVGEQFQFQLHFDGQPLAEQKVVITEAVWSADRKPEIFTLLTDANGYASFPLQRAGTWLALSRHRSKAPADAAVSEYSNSYTLTFRVLEQ
jgi:uncharacterized GH25 family protein